jgi:hypothetical protein
VCRSRQRLDNLAARPRRRGSPSLAFGKDNAAVGSAKQLLTKRRPVGRNCGARNPADPRATDLVLPGHGASSQIREPMR